MTPALRYRYRGLDNLELIVRWYDRWLKNRPDAVEGLSRVTYYMMGANQWRGADAWPPRSARPTRFFLDSGGSASGVHGSGILRREHVGDGQPDRFTYDPEHPPPTRGGSIVSALVPSGSLDQSETQEREDVLVYTTAPLESDLGVVGPVHALIHASSSAVDTDWTAKLTDVFPDGRALVLQSGIVRARFRNRGEDRSLIEPGRVYPYDIDMWATANLLPGKATGFGSKSLRLTHFPAMKGIPIAAVNPVTAKGNSNRVSRASLSVASRVARDGRALSVRHALVVGGGAIGVCSAWYLSRSGWRVTLLERAQVGEGCWFRKCWPDST